MTWDELTEEEKEEWRASETTAAFLQRLKQYESDAAMAVMAASVRDAASRQEIARLGGEHAGWKKARQLLEEA